MNVLIIAPNSENELLPRLKPLNYLVIEELTEELFEKVQEFDLDVVIDLNPFDQTMITNLIYNENQPKLVICNVLSHSATEYRLSSNLECNVYGVSFIENLFAKSSFLEACEASSNEESKLGLTKTEELNLIKDLFGKELKILKDSVALVSARVLAMVINEAYFAIQEEVASQQDIDVAMTLGTNYPVGPLEWAEEISPEIILSILDSLHSHYKEERYKAASALRLWANL